MGGDNMRDDQSDTLSISSIESDDVEAQKELSILELAVKNDPRDYSAHVRLLTTLQGTGDLLRLRRAREAFHKEYPLSERLWKSWLEDELRLAHTHEERLRLLDLYQSACDDYYSASIWLDFVELSQAVWGLAVNAAEPSNSVDTTPPTHLNELLSRIRVIHDQALGTLGMSSTDDAASLWKEIIEFEKEQVSVEENSQRIRELLESRLLAAVDIDYAQAFTEYVEWTNAHSNTTGIQPTEMQQLCKDAEQKFKAGKRFQDKFAQALKTAGLNDRCAGEGGDIPSNILVLCLEYVQEQVNNVMEFTAQVSNVMELTDNCFPRLMRGAVQRALLVFEKSVSLCCLSPVIWQTFCRFVVDIVPVFVMSKTHTLKILRRAVRNCPGDVDLWILYIRATGLDLGANGEGSRNTGAKEEGDAGIADANKNVTSDGANKVEWDPTIHLQSVTEVFDEAMKAPLTTGPKGYLQLQQVLCEQACTKFTAMATANSNLNLECKEQLRTVFTKAASQLLTWYPSWPDGANVLKQQLAAIEYDLHKDEDRCWSIWSDMVTGAKFAPKYVKQWIDFYAYRSRYDLCRDVYKYTSNILLDLNHPLYNPSLAVQYGGFWVEFERKLPSDGQLSQALRHLASIQLTASIRLIQNPTISNGGGSKQSRKQPQKSKKGQITSAKKRNSNSQLSTGNENADLLKRETLLDETSASQKDEYDSTSAQTDQVTGRKRDRELQDTFDQSTNHKVAKLSSSDLNQTMSKETTSHELKDLRNQEAASASSSKEKAKPASSSKEKAKPASSSKEKAKPASSSKEKTKPVSPVLRTVFLVNLPYSTNEEDLSELFTICGDVERSEISTNRKNGRPKGLGSVVFRNAQSVELALMWNGKLELKGRTLEILRHKNAPKNGPNIDTTLTMPPVPNFDHSVIVKGLPNIQQETARIAIKKLFQASKIEITQFRPSTQNQESVVIQVETNEMVDSAIALDGTSVEFNNTDHKIQVNGHKFAKNKPKSVPVARRTRISVPMVPTSVVARRPAAAAASKPIAKSNSDFRKLFD